MTNLSPVKKRKMAGESSSTASSSAVGGTERCTHAQVSPTSTIAAGKDIGAVPLTGLSSTRRTSAGNNVERNTKTPRRGLLPVRDKQAVGTSYAQPAISPGHIVFEKQSQAKNHKVHFFSSQKMPQPFLDK